MAAKKTAKKAAKKAAGKASKGAKAAAPKRGAATKAAKRAPAKKAAKRAAAPKKKHPTVVHWEIQSKDPARLHKFYADLFGWTIDANNPMNYGMVSSGGKDAINGGIGGSMGPASRVLVYAEVIDINATLARVEELGGKTLMPRTDVGPVIMGIFEDSEGNTFGVIEG
jgi:predicted enzyme related to lactoylglutathione lyase